MLTAFDDYPVHQTPLPLAQVGAGNPNFYDRFWFNGFREDLILGVAFCAYPNRQIMDGAFSVVHDGVQRSVFASGRINPDPTDTHMGPIRIKVVEPMRVNQVTVDAPDQGLRAELTYTANTAVVEERRQVLFDGARLQMDNTRATQWGTWTGDLEVDGTAIDLGEGIHAVKDRSWGARGQSPGAPGSPLSVLFLWSPIHFEDECFHFLVFEKPDGTQTSHEAFVVPKIASVDPVVGPGTTPRQLAGVEHRIEWEPGTRRSARATLVIRSSDGQVDEMHLEPRMTFQMKGLGYGHPQWGHGVWHDELAIGGDTFAEGTEPLRPENLHVQQLVEATWRGKTGLGVLEQIMYGPHNRYGFTATGGQAGTEV